MKKILFLILLLSGLTNAQINKDKFHNATLNLRDGTVLKGQAKTFASGIIKFRKNKRDKKTVYNYKTAKSVILELEDTTEVYTYKILSGKKPRLMQIVKEYPGKVNLYMVKLHSINMRESGFSNEDISSTYYINKGKGDVVIKIALQFFIYGNRHFKKTALDFFKDCPALIEKIKNKEFKKRDIEAIVDYYNKDCSKS